MKNKLKRFIKDNFNVVGLLCLFIIIQPLIDILPLYENDKFRLLGFTIPTLVRCIFITTFALLTIRKISKKEWKYLIPYFIILLIYTITHHVITSSSDLILPSNYTYSISQELFYIIRMVFPFIVLKFTQTIDIPYHKFINTLLISSLIISIIIIIGNTFCISYKSYGTGRTMVNWISWFFVNLKEYDFEDLTSKGWFYMANQVSGIMVLLFPFNVYDLLVNKRKISFCSTVLMILSMIMLGTRTSSYGWLLIIIAIAIMYVYFKKKLKLPTLQSNNIYSLLIIILIGILFLLVAPITKRVFEFKIGDVIQFGERPNIEENGNMQEVYTYINNVYPLFLIHDTYIIDVYNYKYDPQFWYNTFDYILENGVIDNRDNQLLIANRIMQLNDYKLKYSLFGYSFSRMRSAGLYPEHDFIVQIFTMGWVGLILLIGPYMAILTYCVIKFIKNTKTNKTLLDLTFIMSLCIIILVSILTSHIFDELFVTIYLGFICGYFLNRINRSSYEEA